MAMAVHSTSGAKRTPKSSADSGILGLSPQRLTSLYEAILKPRLIEERMLILLRQGKVSKWFSGIGQEAISVGCTMALEPDEFILPLHRNLGVFTCRNVPLLRLVAQWQGAMAGFTKGRDRSFHFGAPQHRIVGMISHLGPQLAVADGIALAHSVRKEGKVALVFTGEGGTSEGDFHEALNVAAVWNLPVIFVIENNGYALSTPVREQFRCEKLSDRARGYGMEGCTIDGNDLLEVYRTVHDFAVRLREQPRPVLIECMTFRMRGHEEASGTKYVPPELFEEWGKKDPVDRFERLLIDHGILTRAQCDGRRKEIGDAVREEIEAALGCEEIIVSTAAELSDVYAPSPEWKPPPTNLPRQKMRFVDAISDALRVAMRRHDNLVFMGQDIAEYGGVFKVTEGFLAEFGSARVRNTPLCESAIVGAALGLSIAGMKSVVEMQFADFVTCGFNQIVNNLAKVHYRWNQQADVVVRMPTGAGTAAGPFHSQSNEAWFTHVPGLKVVYPSNPEDAKGLLLAAIEDPNPCMFFEHKLLYRSVQSEVPEGYYTTPIGVAREVLQGSDLAIITYGAGVHWAQEECAKNSELDATILDLRSLLPLDYDAIRNVVMRCGRVIVLHEDTYFGGLGGEIAAWIAENCFEGLDAPVMRVASLDTPVPFNPALEANFLGKSRLAQAIASILSY